MSSANEEERLHAEEEYEVQLHRCGSLMIQNSVVEIMKSTVSEAVVALMTKIEPLIPKCDHDAVSELIRSEYFSAIDRNYPQLMVEIKESLKIPHGQLLPEDAVQTRQYTDDEMTEIRNQTAVLKRKYIYNKQLKEVLDAELNVLKYFNTAKTDVAQYQELYQLCESEFQKLESAMSKLASI